MGISHVPKRFILPVSQRPNLHVNKGPNTTLPLVDLAWLHHNTLRSRVIDEIDHACKEFGFFQVKHELILLIDLQDNYSKFYGYRVIESCSNLEDEIARGATYHVLVA